MKTFHCDGCRHVVFVENTICTHCGSKRAFLLDRSIMAAYPFVLTPPVVAKLGFVHTVVSAPR